MVGNSRDLDNGADDRQPNSTLINWLLLPHHHMHRFHEILHRKQVNTMLYLYLQDTRCPPPDSASVCYNASGRWRASGDEGYYDSFQPNSPRVMLHTPE